MTQNDVVEARRTHATRKTRPLPSTMLEFWELTSAAQSSTKHMLDENVRALAHASLDRLRSVLIQYRWFTSYFTGDLAILIYKLPPSALRSAMAEFLVEELGMGDAAQTHPAMYDRFLTGLGVDPDALETGANPSNLALLDGFRHKLLMGDYMYGIGLRGMGAECLCQVYLEAVHHYLLKNEEIVKRRSELDWGFWDIHASEADQMHGEKTREYIERLASLGNIQSLAAGYIEAEQMFMQFWANAYAGPVDGAATASGRDTFVPSDGWCFDAAR